MQTATVGTALFLPRQLDSCPLSTAGHWTPVWTRVQCAVTDSVSMDDPRATTSTHQHQPCWLPCQSVTFTCLVS